MEIKNFADEFSLTVKVRVECGHIHVRAYMYIVHVPLLRVYKPVDARINCAGLR